MHTRSLILLLASVLALPFLQAQEPKVMSHPDSTIIFGTMEPSPGANAPDRTFHTAMGVDFLVSTNGFGMGTFYRHEYSDNFAGFIDLSVSEAKDDDEREYIDYFGNRFTPGKVNRFLLLPIYIGIQKRMFDEEIMDNFRPFVTAAVGPTMIYVFPYNEEYFSALGKGRFKYTVGGYIGAGAYFGSERSSLLGLNLRYYFIPYPGGLESLQNVQKKQFGAVYISLTFGGAW